MVLIAGGYDKGIPFTQLGMEIVDRVKALILTGDTAAAIRRAVEQAPGFEASGLVIREEEDLARRRGRRRETALEGGRGGAVPRPAPPLTGSKLYGAGSGVQASGPGALSG